MQIAWGEIKDGFRGFERLALTFAKSQFKNPSWKKTNETRDGNKDAIAYVFGYKSHEMEQAQWWMEAKYSTEQTIVTRYRLDATIVSAILQGNVKKIIFITNIAIRAKTIIDIRNALTKATSCQDVVFCTKPILENWLCGNSLIYQEFFPPLAIGDILKRTESLYLTQEIAFYPLSSNSIVFAEPCKVLYCNNHYIGHFSVYCEDNRTVTLKKNPQCRGVSLCGKHTFTLHSGDNPIKFEIALSHKLPKENIFYFLLDNIEIFPAGPIHFSSQCVFHYELPSQKKIIDRIHISLKQFLRKKHCEYCVISAVSGSGKTEMLEQLASKPILTNEYLFYRTFSFSDVENSRLIVDFILFVLFPYLSPEEIDVNYLNRLGSAHISKQIFELIQVRDDYNALVDYLIRKCTPEDFFPLNMKVNARIAFLDNLNYLSETLFSFLQKILVEIQNREIPLYIVATVDVNILFQERWQELASHCNIEIYRFQLSVEDITTVMGGVSQIKETTQSILRSGSLTAVELFTFAQYISSATSEIETIEQLLAAIRLFQYSDILGKEIKAKFLKLFSLYPKCRIICDVIFSSYMPVQISEDFSLELSALLERDLVRYDLYNCLIPRNEAVREYYRSYFGISMQQKNVFASTEDCLRAELENGKSPNSLCTVAKEIIKLTNNKQYNSVIYIGKTQFECEALRDNLEHRMKNRTLFLQMYFAYSYATHMQSNVKNPREHFRRIIDRCEKSVDSQLLELCLRAQWELANSDFENLLYKNVLEDIKTATKTMEGMQKYGFFTGNIKNQSRYHDFMALKCFVESELGGAKTTKLCDQRALESKKCGFIERYYNTKIRLALTRIVTSKKECLHDLEVGTQYFKVTYRDEHKMYLFGEFSRIYYSMVLEKRPSLIENLTQIHEKMKLQQHNNYRKRNFAMATYCYWMGDIETGNRYLFSEIFMIRNLSQRATGFYYETVALYNLRKGEPQQVICSLKQAQVVFSALKIYSQIPEHNIIVMNTTSLEEITIQFWHGESFRPDTYYLDLRITW